MPAMKPAHLLPLFRTQNSEQCDLGFHHGVDGFGFQVTHLIGQGPQTRFIEVAGMHQPIHFQMRDPVFGVQLNLHYSKLELFILDLGHLRLGQTQAVPETQEVVEGVSLMTVSGFSIAISAVTAAVFFGMRAAAVSTITLAAVAPVTLAAMRGAVR